MGYLADAKFAFTIVEHHILIHRNVTEAEGFTGSSRLGTAHKPRLYFISSDSLGS
jgi:hypothetical protein